MKVVKNNLSVKILFTMIFVLMVFSCFFITTKVDNQTNVYAETNDNLYFTAAWKTSLPSLDGVSDYTKITKLNFWSTSHDLTNYTYKGTLTSTPAISVYQNNTILTEIAFVSSGEIVPYGDCTSLFEGCTKVKSFDFSNFSFGNGNSSNKSQFTNTSKMFKDCKSLESLYIYSLNLVNVTNASEMFSGCESITTFGDYDFYMRACSNIEKMFYNCKSLVSLDLQYLKCDNFTTEQKDVFTGCTKLYKIDLPYYAYSFTGSIQLPRTYYVISKYEAKTDDNFIGISSITIDNCVACTSNGYIGAKKTVYLGDTLYNYYQQGQLQYIFGSALVNVLEDSLGWDAATYTYLLNSIKFLNYVPEGYVPAKGVGKEDESILVYEDDGIYLYSPGITVYVSESNVYDCALVSSGPIFLPADCYQLFYPFYNLKYIDFSNARSDFVKNVSEMFGCITRANLLWPLYTQHIEYLDMSSLDFSNVTNADNMFSGDRSITTTFIAPKNLNENLSIFFSTDGLYSNCGKKTTALTSENCSTNEAVSTFTNYFTLSKDWKTDYESVMSNRVSDLTSICFAKTAPENYSLVDVHMANTYDLKIYQDNTTPTKIAFVCSEEIYAPENSSELFKGCSQLIVLDLSCLNFENTVVATDMLSNCNSLQKFISPKNIKDTLTITLPVTLYDTDFNETTAITNELSSKSYYKKYQISYVLGENANWTNEYVAPDAYLYSIGTTLPTSSNVEKLHYVFVGWARNNRAIDAENPALTETLETYCENITFYAIWEKLGYTIAYDANGGSGNLTISDKAKYIAGDKVYVNGYFGGLIKEGYTFVGWSLSNDNDENKVLSLENGQYTIKDSDIAVNQPYDTPITFYAVWKLGTHTCNGVTYNVLLNNDNVWTYQANGSDSSNYHYYLNSGNYYLDSDLTLLTSGYRNNCSLYINNGESVNICLNGHILDLNGNEIYNAGNLKLYDCCYNDETIENNKHYFEYNDEKGTWNTTTNETACFCIGGAIINGNPAVYSVAEKLTAANINFIGNSHEVLGGAIYCEGELLTIDNCYFSHNSCSAYSGMSNGGAIYTEANANIYDSTFVYNTSECNGGAIYSKAIILIDGSTFEHNSANDYGGAIYLYETVGIIYNSTIRNNSALDAGGGIYQTYKESSGGTCLAEGTLILMADGTTRKIEDIKIGDVVKSFDHESGDYVNKKVFSIFKGETKEAGLKLTFSDNHSLTIVGKHGLLEKESLKYVAISADNYSNYLNKYFYNAVSKKWVKLVSVEVVDGFVGYSVMAKDSIDVIADNMLTVSSTSLFMLNVFDFDEDLKINQAKKEQDIEKYGIASYEDFAAVVENYGITASVDTYNNYKIAYAYVAMGKGVCTLDELIYSFAVSEDCIKESNESTNTFLKAKAPLGSLKFSLLKSSNVDTCENYTILGKNTLILGSNAVVTDNTSGIGDNNITSNIYLDKNSVIKVKEGASGISAGITLSDVSSKFIQNGVSGLKSFFISDNENYVIKETEDSENTGTYNYTLALSLKPEIGSVFSEPTGWFLIGGIVIIIGAVVLSVIFYYNRKNRMNNEK